MFIHTTDKRAIDVEADAIIMTAAPDGRWRTTTDYLIGTVAGNQYHQQLDLALHHAAYPRTQVVCTLELEEHCGKFKDVIFVIDDLDKSLGEILDLGLTTADSLGYTSVVLPPLLRQTTSHHISGSTKQKIRETAFALRRRATSTRLASVTIATDGQLELLVHFKNALTSPISLN